MAVNLGSIYAELRLRLDRLQSDIREAEAKLLEVSQASRSLDDQMVAVGKSMQKAGKTMTKYVTAPLVGVATAAVYTGTSFDDSMAKVAAVSGAVGEEFEALRAKARELGATTRFTASDAAAGMEMLARAGFDANEILAAIPGMLDLASAGAIGMAEASTFVADTLKAFGEEADQATRFADIFALTAARANTDVTGLGEAMSYGASSAAAAGMNFEQTAAIMAAFADAGVKSSRAGTTFEAVLRDIKKTAANTGGALILDLVPGMEQTEIAVYDADGNMRDMLSIMADLEAATADLTTEQRDLALGSIFTVESLRGVNILLQRGTEDVRAFEEMLYGASGAAKDMSSVMEDTLGGALREMKSALEEVLIVFSDVMVPVVKSVVEWITKLARWFAGLPDPVKKVIVVVGALVAALGPLLVAFGTLLTMLPLMKAGFAIFMTAAGVVVVPLLKIIAIIAAVSAAVYALYKAWQENWGGIQDIVGNAVDWIMDKFGWLIDGLKSIGGWVKDAWAGVTEFFGWTSKTVVDEVAEMSNEATAKVVEMSQNVENQLLQLSLDSNRISREMADQNIRQAERERDEAIRLAREKADATIAELEYKRDVTGEISAEEASMYIEQAERMRDEAIENAEAHANGVIAEMERMATGSKALTSDMADSIVETSNEMKEMAVKAIKEQHEETVEALRFLRDEVGALTAEQYAAMLEAEEKQKEARIQVQEELNQAVIEKIRELEEKGVEITAEMRAEIEELFFAQRDAVIEATAQMGEEVELILAKLRNESNEITLEMAAEAIKNSAEQRDATVENAEQMYEDSIRAINALSDEAIERSGMTRDEMIQAAKQQRDEIVQQAELMHAQTVSEIDEMMDESIERIDTGTGEILTGWQLFKKNWWENTKEWVSDTIASARELAERADQAIREWLTELPSTIGYWLGRAVSKFIEFRQEVPEIAKRAGKAVLDGFISFISDLPSRVWDILMGVKDRIISAGSQLWSSARTAASDLWEGFKHGLGISSPSYLEEALKQILDYSEYATKSMGRKMSELNRIIQRPDLDWMLEQKNAEGERTVVSDEPRSGNLVIDFARMFEGANLYLNDKQDIEALAKAIFELTRSKARGEGVVLSW